VTRREIVNCLCLQIVEVELGVVGFIRITGDVRTRDSFNQPL
jgi:hypothetical protein